MAVEAVAERVLGQLREGADTDEAQLKAFALSNGPAYAHPRRIVLSTEPLPLTGARKVDRAGIRKRLAELLGSLE